MTIEKNAEKTEGLPEKAWKRLPAGEKPQTRLISEENIDEFYRIGIVDYKKFSQAQWKQLFKNLPKSEAGFLVTAEQWNKITPYFFKGNIRKPFDPAKIKPGLKPLTWLQEFYQKVARFETALSPASWKQLIDGEIQNQFVKNQKLVVDSKFKGYLRKLLSEKPSKLRELETWFHQEEAGPLEEAPAKKSPQVVIHDSFQAKPEEIQKKAAMDKILFQHQQKPEVDDQDSLDFLDELAQEEDEDDII